MCRSMSGIMIHDTNIMSADILSHLIDIPGMTATLANELLNRADKQNVPKAVRLVQCLVSLRQLPPPLDPAQNQRRNIIIFLSRTHHS